MFELLSSLNEKVIPFGDLDGDTFPRVSSPDVQAGVTRATVNGQKVEIGVESSKNRVLLAKTNKVRGSRSQEVRSSE